MAVDARAQAEAALQSIARITEPWRCSPPALEPLISLPYRLATPRPPLSRAAMCTRFVSCWLLPRRCTRRGPCRCVDNAEVGTAHGFACRSALVAVVLAAVGAALRAWRTFLAAAVLTLPLTLMILLPLVLEFCLCCSVCPSDRCCACRCCAVRSSLRDAVRHLAWHDVRAILRRNPRSALDDEARPRAADALDWGDEAISVYGTAPRPGDLSLRPAAVKRLHLELLQHVYAVRCRVAGPDLPLHVLVDALRGAVACGSLPHLDWLWHTQSGAVRRVLASEEGDVVRKVRRLAGPCGCGERV
jgi:hypothetical protein